MQTSYKLGPRIKVQLFIFKLRFGSIQISISNTVWLYESAYAFYPSSTSSKIRIFTSLAISSYDQKKTNKKKSPVRKYYSI